MDEPTFTERAKRLRKINSVIVELDETIRADAFELLKPYADADAESVVPAKHDDDSTKQQAAPPKDEDSLIEKHESDTDYENALLALALLYARHGKGPFAMPRLKQLAAEKNLVIPDRPDAFFKAHKRDSKEVLRKQGDGWKVTPSGETWLKNTYGVTRGKQPLGDATA